MNTFEKIYELVAKIPKGRVTTYGEIAKAVGIGNPRVVGYALHANKKNGIVPCHRVVNKDGNMAKSFAFGGAIEQKKLLIKEGLRFEGLRLPLDKYFYPLSPQ